MDYNIIYDVKFRKKLKSIYKFIAKDSKNRADVFVDSLFLKIDDIKFMPYRYRQNTIKNDTDIRDLIFKGYVVPFLIKDNTIFILNIYKSDLWD
ncbi:type II toxin-antitoxin system RelE/ParE family toxin [Campylobacter mucosalis]|uniref:Putative toxin-antitoxin system, toxin component, RelE/ParE family n=1 Tax=Campylobacter mucosalis CCUG 21559 TaxID=1032067 RepID=A0A6G5QFQ0_9BACT|nr:type II toxin-antitoxin system RelE/ParE family toxin [Campylobacter mucosalis]QCD44444.1 putative toxin-antitoxin system, toxin component, RelE/ParE family [Campylobacter mucosalis CCUG 21559]